MEALLKAAKAVLNQWDTMGWYRSRKDDPLSATCVYTVEWNTMNYHFMNPLRIAVEDIEFYKKSLGHGEGGRGGLM